MSTDEKPTCKNCGQPIYLSDGWWLHKTAGGGVNVCVLPGNAKPPYVVAEARGVSGG